MRGGQMALIAATGASGALAFGVVQSAFTPQAQALFVVYGAMLALMLTSQYVFGASAHGHAGGHGKAHGHGRRAGHGHARAPAHGHPGEGALLLSGRAVGTMMVASAALAAVYFWTDNGLSAEKVGRAIDGGVVSLLGAAER